MHYGLEYLDQLFALVIKEIERSSSGQTYQLLSRYVSIYFIAERLFHKNSRLQQSHAPVTV